MKEQAKSPPDLTNEEEIGSLPEKEFRIMGTVRRASHRGAHDGRDEKLIA